MTPPVLGPLGRTIDGEHPYRIVFVCTGNICRSPMAAAMTDAMAQEVALARGDRLGDVLAVSSAGTGGWHEGEPMDPRAERALKAAGFHGYGHVAHQFRVREFDEADLVVALDRRHLQTLRSLGRGRGLDGQVVLLRPFDPNSGNATDVEDPYYGDGDEFERCRRVIAGACRALVQAVGALVDEDPDPSG
jgi:protein-tyrosine phosphatase